MSYYRLSREFLDICENKDYKATIKFQERIREYLPGKAIKKKIKTICGLDISFNKKSEKLIVAASIFSFPDLVLIDQNYLISQSSFSYIPGLLAFREGPPIIDLLKNVKQDIDLLIFDGQGIAHPRGPESQVWLVF